MLFDILLYFVVFTTAMIQSFILLCVVLGIVYTIWCAVSYNKYRRRKEHKHAVR